MPATVFAVRYRSKSTSRIKPAGRDRQKMYRPESFTWLNSRDVEELSLGFVVMRLSHFRFQRFNFLTIQPSFITFVMADFSISIFTLSATFNITLVSLTFAINP